MTYKIGIIWALIFAMVTPVQAAQRAVDEDMAKPYIGEMKTTKSRYEDTLLTIMRENNLGYVEIRAANPDIDVWIPGAGTKIILPTRHLFPDAERKGIVINLSEMRLYSFIDPENPQSYPIGVGREGLNTPIGETTVTRKKDGPTWRPTPRMREEKPDLPASVPPGDDNPLGTHALYLGWPAYLIHGTHRPWGIGRRVSSGCIRMYPEHITQVFEQVPVGTAVRVVKQPLKYAWIDDVLYLEAHAEDALADMIETKGELKEYDVPKSLFSDLRKYAGAHYDHLDWDHIRKVVKERRGYPIEIFSIKEHQAKLEREKLEKERAEQKALETVNAAQSEDDDELTEASKEESDSAEEKAFFRKGVSRRGFNN